MPPPEVTIVEAKTQSLPVDYEYVGQAQGSREVEVRARVTGILQKRNFKEGATVTRGQSLFTIDPAPFQIALQRAQATVASAEAKLDQAQRNAARLKPLLAQEKKRTARLIGEVPIYDIIIGNEEGEVPLSKLERHLNKLPVNITVKKMDDLESKLGALGSRIGPAAMPKGPLPPQAKMKGVQRSVRRR